jgi:rod shape-determining protein MreB
VLKNLDRLLMEETGIPVILAEDPLLCVVKGCGKTLDALDDFKSAFTYE